MASNDLYGLYTSNNFSDRNNSDIDLYIYQRLAIYGTPSCLFKQAWLVYYFFLSILSSVDRYAIIHILLYYLKPFLKATWWFNSGSLHKNTCNKKTSTYT